MNKERRDASPTSQREAGKTDERGGLNPFRKENPKEIKEDELKEKEAGAEQKRKEALRERD